MILVFVLLGGIGSMRGSIIAAVILTALPELLRGLSDYRMLMYAIILIVMMLVNNNETMHMYVQKWFGGLNIKKWLGSAESKKKAKEGVS